MNTHLHWRGAMTSPVQILLIDSSLVCTTQLIWIGNSMAVQREYCARLAVNSNLSSPNKKSKMIFLPVLGIWEEPMVFHIDSWKFSQRPTVEPPCCRVAWRCKQHSTISSSSKAGGSEKSTAEVWIGFVWFSKLGRLSMKIDWVNKASWQVYMQQKHWRRLLI